MFNDLAKHRWGEDFESWKSQGPFGDLKCDGYFVPERIVFQCYGPEYMDASTTSTKISRDFHGAKQHFENRMAKWVFVHNKKELHATCRMLMASLREQNPDIEIRAWSVNDLLRFAQQLPIDRLSLVCGVGLDGHEFEEATNEALKNYADEHRQPPLHTDSAEAQDDHLNLEQALDTIEADDREIRRRILGYSMWFEPMSKELAINKIGEIQLNVDAINPNLERLAQLGLIRFTGSHILPANTKVCSEAAETFADEFIARLEST